jgi:hypothetical protein
MFQNRHGYHELCQGFSQTQFRQAAPFYALGLAHLNDWRWKTQTHNDFSA